MNKKATDSALLPIALPDGGWGHALAALGKAEDGRRTLAETLADLPANACHELLAQSKGDAASLFGFGAMLGAVLSARRGDAPCFFVRPYKRSGGRLYPPGLAELGIDPARCFSVHAPDVLAALKATADIARSGAAGAVLLEVEGNPRLLDLTASRRLALAAEQAGTAVLLLRIGAREMPSAAFSRWQVTSAPSTPLLAEAPGGPAFEITLLRHRRMAAGQSARLTWNPEERKFDEQVAAPTPGEQTGKTAFGAALSLAARRTADPHTRVHPRRAA
jgi:protein ImuA